MVLMSDGMCYSCCGRYELLLVEDIIDIVEWRRKSKNKP